MIFALFYRKIWSYQKKAVPLHPLSKGSTQSELLLISKFRRDSVAQQVEHIPFKDGVLGSSPS